MTKQQRAAKTRKIQRHRALIRACSRFTTTSTTDCEPMTIDGLMLAMESIRRNLADPWRPEPLKPAAMLWRTWPTTAKIDGPPLWLLRGLVTT